MKKWRDEGCVGAVWIKVRKHSAIEGIDDIGKHRWQKHRNNVEQRLEYSVYPGII